MTRPVHALVLGVALSLLGTTGFASTIEQKGQPEQNLSAMQSYGVNVPTEKGLRSVVPAGWRTYVHQSVTLPDSMSWKPGESWITVVGEVADRCHAVVLIDWQEKAVYLRTAEVALDQGAKEAELRQAATTPLPRFDAAAPARDVPAQAVARTAIPVAAPPLASVATTGASLPAAPAAAVPVIAPTKQLAATAVQAGSPTASVELAKTLAPTETVVSEHAPARQADQVVVSSTAVAAPPKTPTSSGAAQMAAALTSVPAIAPTVAPAAPTVAAQLAPTLLPAEAPRLAASPDFEYQAPVALNKPQARVVAQGIANRFHLRLVWLAPDIQLRGPVTLLGRSVDEDVTLLQKALGLYAPVAFEVPTGQGVLAVRSLDGNYPDLAANTPKPAAAALAPAVPDAHPAAPRVEPVIVAQAPAPIEQPRAAIPVQTVAPVLPADLKVATVVVPSATPVATPAVAPQPPAETPRVLPTADTTVPELELTLHVGQPLEVAVAQFAQSQAYTVDWQVAGGFKAKRELTYHGKTIAAVLSQVLPVLGVSADINTQEKHIVVRPADPLRDL